MKKHNFHVTVTWTGNEGTGTKDYASYSRLHEIAADGKYAVVSGSSAPAFLGDASRYNPEELFISSVASCHMLWYLHLCADHGIVVTDYKDRAEGVVEMHQDGGGRFTEVTLHPEVTITTEEKIEDANKLHAEANKKCFIANSCNFKVLHKPKTIVEEPPL
ncbi:MAG: OsmC family protein [Flavobacteriaceae bacterium]